MMKTSLIATVILIAATSAAHAGGQAGTLGVGAEFDLSGLGGVSATFDGGRFHTGLALGFRDPPNANNSVFDIFGRFYFHVASTAMADFGLGGAVALETVDDPLPGNPGNRDLNVYLEPGFQIRVFLASNVALSFSAGITIGVGHDDTVAIAGQGVGTGITVDNGANVGINGGAGVHYYFF
jgi:hypothetical protein